MNEHLLSDADIFAQHIVIAIDCLDQSRAMDRIFRDPKHSGNFKDAPHFYRTAFWAMKYRFEIEVYKLFDKKGKSFDNFKNLLTQNGLLSSSNAQLYKKRRSDAQCDLTAINNRRNKIRAHSDSEYFNNPSCLEDQNPIDYDCIRELLMIMLSICNGVILRLTDDVPANLHGIGNSDDFVRLFGYETEFDKIVHNFPAKTILGEIP